MSSRNSSVYVHQSSGPSSRSSSSSGHSTNPRPAANTTYREYNSTGYTAQGVRSGNNVVIDHRKRDYDPNSPSPSYRSK